MFDRWQTLIASFDYKNRSFIFINEASIYSLQAEKRNFVINGMQLSNKENRTFLLIDDGRSNVQFYIYLLMYFLLSSQVVSVNISTFTIGYLISWIIYCPISGKHNLFL